MFAPQWSLGWVENLAEKSRARTASAPSRTRATEEPRNQLAGQTWILGFFSGHNYALAHKVGQSTNASGIIDEVKKICAAQPTMHLREATKEAYGNIWDREAKSR